MSLFKRENPYWKKARKRAYDSENLLGHLFGTYEGMTSFAEGSHLSREKGKLVIYGSNQKDYFFDKTMVASCVLLPEKACWHGNEAIPAFYYSITFVDGKRDKIMINGEKQAIFESLLDGKIEK